MTELQRRFFQRMGLPEKDTVNFDDISEIQTAMALTVPFENLDIINGCTRPVSLKNLEDKILVRRRGGLCYELNTLMCYFLKDCGFDAHLVSATVQKPSGEWTDDNGHVTTVLTHNAHSYIIEVGFGSFLPMAPVAFSGEVVTSPAGEYRVLEQDTEKGTHVLQMRQTLPVLDGVSPADWTVGYAFRLAEIDDAQVNRTQATTAENESSPFNKAALIVKRTDTGHISLTPDTFTQTINGERSKVPVTPAQFHELSKFHFGLETR